MERGNNGRQHVFEGYVIDFYCPEDRLAIELDGPVHLKQKDYDEVRQDVIEDTGLEVLRFRNRGVLENIKSVLKRIKKHLTSNQQTQPFSIENGEGY